MATSENHETVGSAEPAAPGRSGRLRRGLRALRAAWAVVGPVQPRGECHRPDDVLWALPWLGLLLGIGWSAVFAGTWRVFGEHQGLRLIPAIAILIVDLALTGRFYMAAVRAAEALVTRDPGQLDSSRRDICAAGALAAAALVVITFALLLAIPEGAGWWPSDWRYYFRRLYPRPIFRPLILMPMWACWSVVLAAGVGRARATDDDRPLDPASRIAGRALPKHIFGGFLPAAALTAVYASRQGNIVIGLAIALGVFVCVYVAAMAAALRWRGQNAVTILACGVIGRTAFLLAWLFTARVVQEWRGPG